MLDLGHLSRDRQGACFACAAGPSLTIVVRVRGGFNVFDLKHCEFKQRRCPIHFACFLQYTPEGHWRLADIPLLVFVDSHWLALLMHNVVDRCFYVLWLPKIARTAVARPSFDGWTFTPAPKRRPPKD